MTEPTPQPTLTGRLVEELKGPAATIIAISILLAFVSAAGVYHYVGKRNPLYLSTSATYLDAPREISINPSSDIIDTLTRLRFKYAAVLRSDQITTEVAAKTGLPKGLVASSIVSRGDTGSLILYVGAESHKPEQAVTLANAFAQALQGYITTEQSSNGIPATYRLQLKIASTARGAGQISPTKKQRYTSGIGAGLAIGIAFGGIADVVRRRRTLLLRS